MRFPSPNRAPMSDNGIHYYDRSVVHSWLNWTPTGTVIKTHYYRAKIERAEKWLNLQIITPEPQLTNRFWNTTMVLCPSSVWCSSRGDRLRKTTISRLFGKMPKTLPKSMQRNDQLIERNKSHPNLHQNNELSSKSSLKCLCLQITCIMFGNPNINETIQTISTKSSW